MVHTWQDEEGDRDLEVMTRQGRVGFSDFKGGVQWRSKCVRVCDGVCVSDGVCDGVCVCVCVCVEECVDVCVSE